MTAIRSLYLHIPFCERKCEYCDFTSVAGTRGARAYMHALTAEIRMLGESCPGTVLDTVFVGGGTPSLVEPDDLAQVMESVRVSFALMENAEVTLEANPSSTSTERARAWREAGFNRVSLGVQSLEASVLGFLGRVHDAERALHAIDAVRAAGFENVNCDLIYAVPGLSDEAWLDTLERILARGPDHVSCYELTVEPGTPLHRSVRRGEVTPRDDVEALRQHALAVDSLSAAGYHQYEVSNFARSGRRCRHNLVYWRNGFYLAAGVGAHGHVPLERAAAIGLDAATDAAAVRYWHGRGIGAYIETVGRGRLPVRGHESITPDQREAERLMLGLRLSEGVRLERDALAQAEVLAGAGLLTVEGSLARVTRSGEQVLNTVALRLVDAAAA